MLSRLRSFWQGLWERSAFEHEMDEELRFHLEARMGDLVRSGLSREEAARRARIEFGGVEAYQDRCREARGLHLVDDLGNDLRHGLRMLAKSPGFTAVAILTLALGIGANTAIFSVVNAVLLRPLPFVHPEQLVQIFQTLPEQGVTDAGVSYPNFTDWSQQSKGFEEIAALRQKTFALTGNGEPSYVDGATVTSSLFPLLGVQPIFGRTFLPADDQADASPVVVLGEGLWRRQFGADPALVGKTILLDKQSFTVVGILPASFRFPFQNPPAQVWIPLLEDLDFKDLFQKRAGHYLNTVVGRLKPGISFERGTAELVTVANRLALTYPDANRGWGVRLVPLQRQLVGDVRIALWALLGAVGLVLLIACANVASVLLARTVVRAREMSIRTALGASRGRLIRQLLTESVVLGGAGGVVGLLVAYWGVRSLAALIPNDIPRIHEFRVDAWVLGFTLLVSLLASFVFGLTPALHSASTDLHEALKEGGRGTGESRKSKNARRVLVAAEVALAVVLLIGAGLLLRSFARLQQVNPGFEPENVLIATLSLPQSQYSKPEHWTAFYDQLLDRLKSQPGVLNAAAALPLPPTGSGFSLGFQIKGQPPQRAGGDYSADYSAISPDYFQTMQIPILRGRFFTVRDTAAAPKVCAISEAFARRYFPNDDPLGKQLIFGYREQVPRQIVAVVGNVKQTSLTAPGGPEMYVPYSQNAWWAMGLVVRTTGDPAAFSTVLREVVGGLDKDLPIADIQPLTQVFHESMAPPRFRTLLLAIFGATALLLATAGIYGVISYDVGQRTHEIGIRMALGAQRSDVLRLGLAEGISPALVGLCVGLAAAWFATRLLSSLLFEVDANDLTTFAAAAVLLAAVAFLACYIPARRAVRIDPMVALRYE
jgi:predicted permease